jgi:hypothetical protein
MTYNEPIKGKAYEEYAYYDTRQLWNELTACDEIITGYFFGTKQVEKNASKPATNTEKIFHRALEDSVVLLQLLKKKPKSEIYELREYLHGRLYVANERGREYINSHIGFIEKELL